MKSERTEMIRFRLTKAERVDAEERAEQADMTISEWFRSLAFGPLVRKTPSWYDESRYWTAQYLEYRAALKRGDNQNG